MYKRTPSQDFNSKKEAKILDDWMFGVDDTYYEEHQMKCVNTTTPGPLWAPLLVGTLLGITLVLFISLPISQTNDSTLGENIFGHLERLRERRER